MIYGQQGIFAVGADDVLRFHAGENEVLADLPSSSSSNSVLLVHYEPRQYAPAASRDWIIKLLNLAVMLGAVELLIALDTYRSKRDENKELSMHAFARVDLSKIVNAMLKVKPTTATGIKAITSVFESQVFFFLLDF